MSDQKIDKANRKQKERRRNKEKQGGGAPSDMNNLHFTTSEKVSVTTTFDAMNLREDLLRGIYAYGQFYMLKKLES